MPKLRLVLALTATCSVPGLAQDAVQILPVSPESLMIACLGARPATTTFTFCRMSRSSLVRLPTIEAIPDRERLRADARPRTNPLALPRDTDADGVADALFSFFPGETALIQGFAMMVNARFRQDVQALGFEQLERRLCVAEVRQLLPSACAVLASSVRSTLPAPIAALRDAAQRDLQHLPEKALLLLGAQPPVRLALVTLARVAQDALERQSFVGALASVNIDPEAADSAPALRALLRLRAMAESYRAVGLTPEIGADSAAMIALRLGLVSLRTLGNEGGIGTGLPLEQVRALIQAGVTIDSLLRAHRSVVAALQANGDLDVDTRAMRVRREVAAAVFRVAAPLAAQLFPDTSVVRRVLPVLAEAIDLAAQSNYTGSLVAVSRAVLAFHPDERRRWGYDLEARALAISELASARDADGVAAALNRLAAPTGSFRRKRRTAGESPVYVTFNAYLGASFGRERPIEQDAWSKHAGLVLPVGIEVGLRLHRNWSVGLFVFPVDIGALGSLRLEETTIGPSATGQDTTIKQTPEIGFNQIMAPGAALVVGLGRLPLAAGVTYGYVPSLRETSVGESLSIRRWAVFLAYDLPLF